MVRFIPNNLQNAQNWAALVLKWAPFVLNFTALVLNSATIEKNKHVVNLGLCPYSPVIVRPWALLVPDYWTIGFVEPCLEINYLVHRTYTYPIHMSHNCIQKSHGCNN